MREEKVAKDKEKKEAVRVFEQIEAKASRSYQKDISTFKEARESNANALAAQTDGEGTAKGAAISGDWEFESSSGYYYNQSNGCYYDPNSGFYYTDALGKWVTQEEALAASQVSSNSLQRKPIFKKPSLVAESKNDGKSQNQRAVSGSINPARSKAAPSSLTINKRKRQDEKPKPKVVSEVEATALKAREAARKRVEEREKPLLGLYRH